jgi:hypothetical protein
VTINWSKKLANALAYFVASSLTKQKTVLKHLHQEMKSEELRALRADKIRLEEKLADFDQMKQSLQKATALVEDLKAQIDAKNNLER